MNIFDKDYKMLKTLEKEAKPRSAICDGTTSAASRLIRLLELGYIISDSWELVPGQEAKFRLTGEGRAYIQNHERETFVKWRDRIIFSFITPIILSIITTIITLFITKALS